MKCLAVACGLLLVAGCSSTVMLPATEANRLPPMFLSLHDVSVTRGAMSSPGATSSKTAKEVFWLSMTALLTLGAPLLDLPNVLERGKSDAEGAQRCIDSWNNVLKGVDAWLQSGDLRSHALDTIRVEAMRLLSRREPLVRIDVAPSEAVSWNRAEAVREMGRRLATSDLIVVDVRLGVAPSSTGCTAEIRAKADVHHERIAAQRPAAALGRSSDVVTLERSEGVDVLQWAAEPDTGRRVLQNVLVQLAQDIVDAYPWPAPVQQKLPESLPERKAL